MELDQLKAKIQEEVEDHRQELIEMSLKIHANPELGWREERASGWLADCLEKNGFKVERGVCDLPTAFLASYGKGKPVVAFLCEYDSTTDKEHGCGHNIIGTSGVGAGIAAKLAADSWGGTIMVVGSPAEELLGGKIVLADKGVFNEVDAALMLHPTGEKNWIGFESLACILLDVEFWGRPSHAAADPWNGISALEALILAFNNINGLRLQTRDRSRIAGIITDGGKAANVVPEHSAGAFMVRATDDAYLDELCQKVVSCFEGAAKATGARLEYRWGMRSAAMRTNSILTQLWIDNMESLGRGIEHTFRKGGSTDMGNVSLVTPGIHPFIAISPRPLTNHSSEFAAASASESGNQALIDGAKALAMTAADVIAQPETLSRVKEEFRQQSREA